MMKSTITTGTGDNGSSSILSGQRAEKDHPLFQALGSLDELSCHLGLLKIRLSRGFSKLGKQRASKLEEIQRRLMDIMALISASLSHKSKEKTPVNLREISKEEVKEELDLWLEDLSSCIKEFPRHFTLPGCNEKAVLCDICRAVCRRGERDLVHFINSSGRVDLANALVYLNRLSDGLYLLMLIYR